MQYALLILRRRRDHAGQPVAMADGEPCYEMRRHPFSYEHDEARAACGAIGIAAELDGLVNEDDMAEERCVEIPRRAIAALRVDMHRDEINGVFVTTRTLRLDRLIQAHHEMTAPETRCFLEISVR